MSWLSFPPYDSAKKVGGPPPSRKPGAGQEVVEQPSLSCSDTYSISGTRSSRLPGPTKEQGLRPRTWGPRGHRCVYCG